jgi:hypothetical protein
VAQVLADSTLADSSESVDERLDLGGFGEERGQRGKVGQA